MNDFHPPPDSDSRGITIPTCKDRGEVELDVASGSNAENSGCIDPA